MFQIVIIVKKTVSHEKINELYAEHDYLTRDFYLARMFRIMRAHNLDTSDLWKYRIGTTAESEEAVLKRLENLKSDVIKTFGKEKLIALNEAYSDEYLKSLIHLNGNIVSSLDNIFDVLNSNNEPVTIDIVSKPVQKQYANKEVIASYDVTIYKNKNIVHELEKPIKITFKLDAPVNKAVEIIREHENEAPVVLQDLDTDPSTVTVETNKFSTYTIVVKEDNAVINKVNSNTKQDVATSDYTLHYALTMLVAFILFRKIKKA